MVEDDGAPTSEPFSKEELKLAMRAFRKRLRFKQLR